MNIRRFAAIDIGSNAIRLLISNVIEHKNDSALFRKYSLVRVPIRLGHDVFLNKCVSEINQSRIEDAMKAFKLLMEVHGVERYRACATSAMREAQNSKEVAASVLEKSGISIEIIDGNDEANIIANNYLNAFMDDNKNYLYVDVGGGSTEFTIYSKGDIISSQSFKIGTLRLLNNMVSDACWSEVQTWIIDNTSSFDEISLVGSGGNINKIFKASQEKLGKALSVDYMKKNHRILNSYTYEERIRILELNPDRADVIVHASLIFLNAMQWSRAKYIFVPKIGLSDGIIKWMYITKKGNLL